MKSIKVIYLLLLFCLIISSECLLTEGNKKHGTSNHTSNIVKKQQVFVPLGNFAASSYGQNNAMSAMFHLEGTNEVAPLKEPSTVFVNGNNQANPYMMVPMESRQTEDNEEQLQESPLEYNNFRTDSSLFDDRIESFRDGTNGNEDSDNGNVVYAGDNQQASPYEQTNDGYLNQTPQEEANEPSQTMVDYNNDGSNDADSYAAVQGLPTLSSAIASRLRAENTLNSLGLRHSAVEIPNYASLVKQLLKHKALGVKKPLKLDPGITSGAAKKDDATKGHTNTKHDDEEEKKKEDAKKQKQEYKKMVQNAEIAANLAEAAKTLTKLVTKLTEHGAIISRKQEEKLESRKNNSEAVDGGWSEWSNWSTCSATCGGGLKYTKRNCTSPSPSHGGQHCLGKRLKVRMCNFSKCFSMHNKKVNLQRSLSEMAEARSRIYKT